MLNDSVLKNHRPALPQHRQLFTDAIVTVGAEDFQVHRGILSAASPYFHFLFSSRMQEGVCAKVVVAEMNPETFSLLLDWMYGTIDMVLTLDKAVDLV
ncbi:TPA: hypothetical protein ACH3X3_012947 [Trebouxia sp. C0006]